MIDLINVGGNTGSVSRCLSRIGIPYRFVLTASEIGGNPIILPGVGAFGAVMTKLAEKGFPDKLKSLIQSGIPYLGICVGMQILFETSEESADVKGLGILGGNVRKFKNGKVPQIGWNSVDPVDRTRYLPGYAYFINSYYAEPDDDSDTIYYSDYHGIFCAAVKRKNATGFQFHPEKSGPFGHDLVRRWSNAL